MIRGSRKFVTWPESGRQALYDIRNDPRETNDLLAHAARQGSNELAGADWARELQGWWARHDRLRPDDFTLDAEPLERLRSLGYIRQ